MRWVDVHARLLDRSLNPQLLTPSQQEAASVIARALVEGVQYINLYGGPGVGKTFLARHLAHELGCCYMSGFGTETLTPIAERWVLVDNAPENRGDARAVYGDLLHRSAVAVLVITHNLVRDSLFTVPLNLTKDDQDVVRSTVAETFPSFRLSGNHQRLTSLWTLVRLSCDE